MVDVAISKIAKCVHRLNSAIKGNWGSTNGQPRRADLCAFCDPINLCVRTCFCPCVTFGKTDHRLQHGGDMSTYDSINTSCFVWYISACFGLQWIPTAVQVSEVRGTHSFNGSCAGDICKSFYCTLCALVQAEKESKQLSGGRPGGFDGVVEEQYTRRAGAEKMVYAQEMGLTEQGKVLAVAVQTPLPMETVIEEAEAEDTTAGAAMSERPVVSGD